MKQKSNKNIENSGENLNPLNELSNNKMNKAKFIIPIVILGVLIIVFFGIVVFNNFMIKEKNKVKKEDVIQNENKIEKEDIIKDKSENEDVVVEESNKKDDVESVENDGTNCTTFGEELIITDDMKKELNSIAYINRGYCFSQLIFHTMNGYINDLSLESKQKLIINYYVMNNWGRNKISETEFNEIAAKYSISDSFDTVMAGLEKDGNEYIIPGMGCETPLRLVHDLTYADTGNTITVIDNAKIVNSETQVSESIKVIYTFVYSKNGENITFRLAKVNTEK